MKTPKVLARSVVLLAGLAATGWAPVALAKGETVKLERDLISGGGALRGELYLPLAAAEETTYTITTITLLGAAAVSAPVRVIVRKGERSGTFALQTLAVRSPERVTVCARREGKSDAGCGATAALRIVPAILQSLTLSRVAAVGGAPDQTVTGGVTLEEPAPPGGVSASLTQSLPLDSVPVQNCKTPKYSVPVSVPPSVQIPEGSRTASFPITTFLLADSVTPDRQVAVAAALEGEAKSATLTIRHWRPVSLVLAPAAATERTRTATLTLNAAAPSSLAVDIRTNNTSVMVPSPGAAGSYVPQGSATHTFALKFLPELPRGTTFTSCRDIQVFATVVCATGEVQASVITLCP